MVRLTRIYTRGGDGGETHLADMSRVRKSDARVAAMGDVDEANAAIGVARAGGLAAAVDAWLARVQNDLFDLGADLARPGDGAGEGAGGPLRIQAAQVRALEGWCDEANAPLSDLTSFILPGGAPTAAALHLARAVVRRAERTAVALAEEQPVNPEVVSYLNRLSDLLFILARSANAAHGDVLWEPGAGRGGG